MKLGTHLVFDGRCEAAFKLYERCLGGKALHATLIIGNNTFMGADALPEQYERPKGFHVLLGTEDPGGAERIYQAPAENGTVQMPLQA